MVFMQFSSLWMTLVSDEWMNEWSECCMSVKRLCLMGIPSNPLRWLTSSITHKKKEKKKKNIERKNWMSSILFGIFCTIHTHGRKEKKLICFSEQAFVETCERHYKFSFLYFSFSFSFYFSLETNTITFNVHSMCTILRKMNQIFFQFFFYSLYLLSCILFIDQIIAASLHVMMHWSLMYDKIEDKAELLYADFLMIHIHEFHTFFFLLFYFFYLFFNSLYIFTINPTKHQFDCCWHNT